MTIQRHRPLYHFRFSMDHQGLMREAGSSVFKTARSAMTEIRVDNNTETTSTISVERTNTTHGTLIGSGTLVDSTGDARQISVSSSSSLPENAMDVDDALSDNIPLTQRRVTIATSTVFPANQIGAICNDHYFHQADETNGDQGQWPIHHKRSDGADDGLESALETFIEGGLQFVPGELRQQFEVLDIAPEWDGKYGMAQAAEMLTRMHIESCHCCSVPLHPPGARLDQLMEPLGELLDYLIENDETNEGTYLLLDERMIKHLTKQPHELLSNNFHSLPSDRLDSLLSAHFHAVLDALRHIVDETLRGIQPVTIDIDGQNVAKADWLKQKIEETLYRCADRMSLQNRLISHLDCTSTDGTLMMDKLMLMLTTNDGGKHAVCFRVVQRQWHCFDGRHESPETITPQAYMQRAMTDAGINGMEIVLPKDPGLPAIRLAESVSGDIAFEPVIVGDIASSPVIAGDGQITDAMLIPDLPSEAEICDAVRKAFPDDTLRSNAKRCAAIFLAPSWSASHAPFHSLNPREVAALTLDSEGRIKLGSKEIKVAPEYQEIYNEYINGVGGMPARGKNPGPLFQVAGKGKSKNTPTGKSIRWDSPIITGAMSALCDWIPQFAYMQGSGITVKGGLKMACLLALKTEWATNTTNSSIARIRNSQVDHESGKIDSFPPLSAKARKLVRAHLHAQGGDANDYFFKGYASDVVPRRITARNRDHSGNSELKGNMNRDLMRYKKRMTDALSIAAKSTQN